MSTVVSPRSAIRPDRRLRTWACTETSSPETASSATRTSGRGARALAMAMRWRRPRGQAHRLEHLVDPGPMVAGDAQRPQGLGHDVADPHAGVEGAHGVLEHDLDPPAQLREPGAAPPAHRLAPEEDLARRWLLQGEEQPGQGRLARHPERLTRPDLEVHAPQGPAGPGT